MKKFSFRKAALWAAFLFLILFPLIMTGLARADTIMPVWTNDNAAKTLSFNDSFGHDVVVGTYNSGTGVWSPGSISVGASFTGGLISISGSPVTGTGTLGFTVAGTSGGIPYFSSATTWASSAILATNQIMLGKGAAAAPATLGSLGTVTQVLHGNAAGAPTFGAVVTADIATALTTPGPIGSVTPSTVAATDISSSGVVSGTGFTARFATPGPIGNTAASTGNFSTLSSVTAGATNTIGVTAGSAGTTGNVGEILTANASAVSLVTATAKDIVTLGLTAGSWQCWGALATAPAGSTTTTAVIGSINAAANTISTAVSGDAYGGNGQSGAGNGSNFALSPAIINTSGTPTMHLVMQAFFAVSTMTGSGQITCVRIR